MNRSMFGAIAPVLALVLSVAPAGRGFAAGLERTAEVAGVSASVRPLNPEDQKAPTLDFVVTMDTHAGSLPLNVAKISTARGPKGETVPAVAWKGGSGGHHITGTLSFPSGSLRAAAPLTVTLQGAGGKDLVFVWTVAFVAAPVGTLVPVDGGSYRNISPSTLNALLKQKDFFLVNVHVPYDGEIATTDAFIPFDRTRELLGRYPAARSARIVVYCRSGRMSDIAARELVRQGYTDVLNLDGGMSEWEKQGMPLRRDPARS